MTKEKLKKLLETNNLTEDQLSEAYEVFYRDANNGCTLLVEYIKFWQVVLQVNGTLSQVEMQRCTYAYIGAIENNHPEHESYLVALYNRQAEYFAFLNCPKDCLYYANKILDLDKADPVYYAAAIIYILNILASASLFNTMLEYVDKIKELIDNEVLQPIYKKVLKLSLMDIFTFNNMYHEYLDIINDLALNENTYGENDPTKEAAIIHLATSKFAFKEILKFKRKEDLLQEFENIINNLKNVHGIQDTLEPNIIPVFNVIKDILPREELIAKITEILACRLTIVDKIAIYEYLIRTLKVTYEEYPNAYQKYFMLLERYNRIRRDLEKQTTEISLVEYNLQQKYKTAALVDKLTGLESRYAYNSYIDKLKISSDLMIVVADINRLKYINDNYGHDVGDQALIIGANNLRKAFGQMGKIFRYGGDEFYIFAHGTKEDVKEAIKKLNTLNNIQFIDNFKFEISVGYALVSEFPGENLDYIIRMTDRYMYQTKMKYYEQNNFPRREE